MHLHKHQSKLEHNIFQEVHLNKPIFNLGVKYLVLVNKEKSTFKPNIK